MEDNQEEVLEQQDVPSVGTDNKPIVKHEKGKEKPLKEPFVYPDTQTGYNYFWNRKLIGKRKLNHRKVVQDYLERSLEPSQPPKDQTYPYLADINVAE